MNVPADMHGKFYVGSFIFSCSYINIVVLRVVEFGSLFCCILCEKIREKGIARF